MKNNSGTPENLQKALNEEMLTPKSWEEFRSTGLLTLINSILHVFGWVIIVTMDEHGNVIGSCPARTRYRGFDNKVWDEAHVKMAKYLNDNSAELLKEAEA